MDDSASIGHLLRRHRLAAGLTQEQLAERAGVSVRGVSDLERGLHRTPHAETLRRLVEALALDTGERAALQALREEAGPRRPVADQSQAPRRRWAASLPLPLTSFVGRAQQVDELRRLMRRERALTLVGAGGVGKTRLALHMAGATQSDYAAGACLVELAPLAEPQLLVETVAAAFGVREQPGRPLLQTLAAELGTHHVLLVLDNCEHLVDACAELVRQLLGACPRLGVLATSRESLGFAGETVWRVPPLGLPDDGGQPSRDALFASEAVSLFVERATAARADFTLDELNAAVVAQLCQLLEGLPLAIELAAAWVSSLVPRQIVARLDELLGLAPKARAGVPARHRTLRAAVDWSYSLLTEQEQRLFNRVSVFAGGWTLGAAEAVCAGADDAIQPAEVVALLARLVDTSLVQVDFGLDEARYRLLEVLRQYGRERLAATGETELTRTRHAAFCVALATAAAPELWRPAVDTWQAKLERELDNLRVALRWLIGRGEAAQAQRLGAPLARFCQVGNYLSEGRAWVAEILALPGGEGSVEHARVLIGAGLLDTYLANIQEAQANLEQGVEVSRVAGDETALATGLYGLGFLAWGRGDYETVRRVADEGLTVSRRAPHPPFEALHLFLAAVATIETGDRVTARALANHSVALATDVGYVRAVPMALSVLGWLGLLDEDHATAASTLERALALFDQVGFPVGTAWALGLLSRVAAAQGEAQRAVALASKGLQLALALKLNARVPWCLEELAGGLASTGQLEPAVRLTAAADRLRRQSGIRALPTQEILLARWLEPTRVALGPRADTAWAEGVTLSPQQAIAVALSLGEQTLKAPTA